VARRHAATTALLAARTKERAVARRHAATTALLAARTKERAVARRHAATTALLAVTSRGSVEPVSRTRGGIPLKSLPRGLGVTVAPRVHPACRSAELD
jgi:hypothetical protein